VDRNKPIDISKLNGYDYRLFQNTPAWELAKAVQDADRDKIDKILFSSPDLINFQDPKYGETLLMLTVMNQQMKSFKILLAHNARVDIHDTFTGGSAIIEACKYDSHDIEFVKLLVQNGANVNDVEIGDRKSWNSTRFTPLMAASRAGRLDMVTYIVEQGANVNFQNEYMQTALTMCMLLEHYDIALYLLEHGMNYRLPIFIDHGDNAVWKPADDKPIYIVDVLRCDIFDLNSKDYKLKMKIVDFLKQKGVDYRNAPIPDHIRDAIQKKYPHRWEKFMKEY
jgi:ankyrin repeat protein